MGPIDALLHLANLFAMPLGTALIASGLAKLAGGAALRATPLRRLLAWSSGAALLALLGGWIAEGRDGRMLTHGAVVVLVALALAAAARRGGSVGGVSRRASAPRRAASAAGRS